jgi:hypothetical protein
MRTSQLLALGLMIIGCGSADDSKSPAKPGNQGKAGASQGDSGAPATSGEAGAGAGGSGDRGEIGTPVQIAPGQASLLGVTSDDWMVFRDGDVLRAAKVGDAGSAREITAHPGSVLIRGRVVFNWADVNWEQGIGNLSVWTSERGSHELGPTPYSETLVAASQDGSSIVFTANTRELGAGGSGADEPESGSGGAAPAPDRATDLVLASSDLSEQRVLIESVGLGSESTCNPSFGFVGERLLVGWCIPGSRSAKIERYEQADDGWSKTTIAEDTLPGWSADAAGDTVFYQSSGYSGYVLLDGDPLLIDAGVSAGTLLPDGKTVLYSVGDQLRRAQLPSVNPVAIVTTGYKQPVGFSPDFGLALYSTTVTYEQGTQRDLLLTTTAAFNSTPLVLVDEPIATLPRSHMTRDGRFIFWLTGASPRGGTLHVVDELGAEVVELPNVLEAVAGEGSLLVFTDNPSDPDQYPVVADLKIMDLALEDAPRLVEEKIVDGKSFQLNRDGTLVSYVRSGVDRDSAEAGYQGVFSVSIR